MIDIPRARMLPFNIDVDDPPDPPVEERCFLYDVHSGDGSPDNFPFLTIRQHVGFFDGEKWIDEDEEDPPDFFKEIQTPPKRGNTLCVVNGVSGSGKSSFSETLQKMGRDSLGRSEIFSEDDFFYRSIGDGVPFSRSGGKIIDDKNRAYEYDPDMLQTARQAELASMDQWLVGHANVHSGVFCIWDGVVEDGWQYEMLETLAEHHGFEAVFMILENRHEGESIHDVPRKDVLRQHSGIQIFSQLLPWTRSF